MKRAIIAYVPVLHRGYLDFFRKQNGVSAVYLLGDDIVRVLAEKFPEELSYIVRKDIMRAVTAEEMQNVLCALGVGPCVHELRQDWSGYLDGWNQLKAVAEANDEIVMPDEDIMRRFSETYLAGKKTVFDSVFLRWHRGNVEKEEEVKADRLITVTDFDKECMARAFQEGEKSADWWRQVGGVIVKDGAPLLWAHNVHAPFPEMPYIFGDPRSMWSRGVRIELTTAEHVESVLVAEAARRGIALLGADLYLTDFPCPPCAKIIARAGFRRLYYTKGSYAMLQGESIVRSRGAEIVRIVF